MSQSPEGSTVDFHIGGPSIGLSRISRCLNPPKGRRSISTYEELQDAADAALAMSQSLEGSTVDFHAKMGALLSFVAAALSQSPEGSTADFHLVMTERK